MTVYHNQRGSHFENSVDPYQLAFDQDLYCFYCTCEYLLIPGASASDFQQCGMCDQQRLRLQSLHLSKCHINGNHMPRLKFNFQ